MFLLKMIYYDLFFTLLRDHTNKKKKDGETDADGLFLLVLFHTAPEKSTAYHIKRISKNLLK